MREDGVIVWAARRDDATGARLGLAIRAQVGTAVERNRLRRRMRSIFTDYAPEGGRDVIIQATGEATGRNFQELTEILGRTLARAGVGRTR